MSNIKEDRREKVPLVPEMPDLMPFIRRTPTGARDFWKVEEPADYGVACALGEGYARLALRNAHEFKLGAANFLHCILTGMVNSGNQGGVEVGFIQVITKLAAAGFQQVPPAGR